MPSRQKNRDMRHDPGPETGAVRHSSGERSCARRGFTLIELMIAVAVVALLAAVAIPSFLDSVRKGRRSDAFAALNTVQLAQERWRANQPAYAGSGELTLGVSASPPGLGLSATTANGYYTLSLSNDPAETGGTAATSYIATATAVSGRSQASDGTCVRLRVRIAGGNIFYGSAAATGAFDESAGNRCWAR